tara:strand:+ start:1958 stop:2335 length:378 start_codon:yes stop_codon:yes gene_type:complete
MLRGRNTVSYGNGLSGKSDLTNDMLKLHQSRMEDFRKKIKKCKKPSQKLDIILKEGTRIEKETRKFQELMMMNYWLNKNWKVKRNICRLINLWSDNTDITLSNFIFQGLTSEELDKVLHIIHKKH